MSPTVFRKKGFRFFFFSLEEDRMHVHVKSSEGSAKFWLEPKIKLAMVHNIPAHKLNIIDKIVQEHQDELKEAWQRYLGD